MAHRTHRFSPLLEGFAVVSLYTVLALVLLHSVFTEPTRSVPDPAGPAAAADINLNIWILAWEWHALTTHPWTVFDANAFHPAPSALALSEHMFGHLPIFGPIYALSGNPVFANQMDLLAAFVLSAAAMYALLRHWRAPVLAALFAGFVYGFCPTRVLDTGHIQHTAGQYLPLALLYLDRTLTGAKLRTALALLLFLLLQMLCSYYLAYMTMTAVTGYALGILWATRGRLRVPGVLLAVGAALLAGAAVGLLSLPYLHLKQAGVVPDYVANGQQQLVSSGLWQNFLYPPAAYQKWGLHLDRGVPAYVGIVPLLLAVLGVFARPSDTHGPRRWARYAACGAALACYVMALGPELNIGAWALPLPYKAAMFVIPGFSSMRAPIRFAQMLMCGLAALSGLGLGRILTRLPASRGGKALAAIVVIMLGVATAAEYGWLQYTAPRRHVALGAELPPVYRALQQADAGAVLEIPAGGLWYDNAGMVSESEYMLYSTFHWHPLLNGYSGYWPRSYLPVVALARALPDARATELLVRMTGMRYVIVHLLRLPPLQRERWVAPPGLRRVGSYGSDLLFEVEHPAEPDLLAAFIDWTPRTQTLLGTPLQPVPVGERRAELEVIPPETASGDAPFSAEVLVTNRSAVTWPALAPLSDGLVWLGFEWQNETGTVIDRPLAVRLPYDLGPGESARAVLTTHVPAAPGNLRLVIRLLQDGVWFPDNLTVEFSH